MPPGIQPATTFPTGQNGVPAGANMIGQLLTTPRPGGLNGPNGSAAAPPVNTGATPQAAAAAPTIGGGIAGVASKREQEGIKVYKDKTKYNEWEFVYDISKDPVPHRRRSERHKRSNNRDNSSNGNSLNSGRSHLPSR